MPDLSAQRATMRLSGYSTRCYASFYVGELVAETTLAVATPLPVRALIVSAITSPYDYTDILPGYRVDIYSAGGDYKGSTRVRFGNTITDTVIHVRETSLANIYFVTGDIVRVYNDLRLSDKLVEANQLFSPDGTPFTDQGSNPPPVACSGGHYAGRVDDGQTFATIQMVGSTSYVVDPDSTPGNVSHLWTLPSGVAFQSGSVSTDADPVIEADPGEHLILHTVTDDDNSKTTTQCVIVMVTDDSNPPHKVAVTSLEATPDSGWTFGITVLSGATSLTAIPDGCLCILWSRERMGGNWQSLRGAASGREHILGVGIVARDTSNQDASTGVQRVSFEVISPLARLRQFTGYSKVMEESASPDGWSKVKTLGVKRAILQLIQFYSTLVESGFDFIIDDDLLDERYPALYLQRSTPYDQTLELATGIDARLICDRSGRFDLHTHPAFIPYDDRAAVTETMEIALRDILEYSFDREHHDKIEVYKISGFSGGASGNSPYFSLYPGDAPNLGTQTPTRDRLIVDATSPQDDLNERAGRYGALIDNVLLYQNGSSEWVKTRAGVMRLRLRGSYDVFDFYKEYTTIAITNNARGVSFAHRFYPTNISVTYDEKGAAVVDLTLQMETNAAAGTTFIPVEQATPPYTPPILTPSPLPSPSLTPRLPSWGGVDQTPTQMVALAAGSAQFAFDPAITPSGGGLSVTWQENSTGLGSGAGHWLTADPYDYRRYFALMSDGLYRNDNPKGGSSWSLVANNATIWGDASRVGVHMQMSINKRGYIALASGNNAFAYSSDYGSTWSVVAVDGAALNYFTAIETPGGTGTVSRLSFDISPHNSSSVGHIYACRYTGSGFGAVYKSTDWGANWTTIATGVLFGWNNCSIHVPYKKADGSLNVNGSSQHVILIGGSGSATSPAGVVQHSSNGGTTWSAEQSYAAGGGIHRPAQGVTGWALMSFTGRGDILLCASRINSGGAGVFWYEDYGGTLLSHSNMFAQGLHYAGVNGSPVHSGFGVVWVRNSGNAIDKAIYYTLDAGANWQSLAPPSFFTGGQFCANVQIDISSLVAPA